MTDTISGADYASLTRAARVVGFSSGNIGDAPADGETYGRKDGAWSLVAGDAPSDTPDLPYVRIDQQWVAQPETWAFALSDQDTDLTTDTAAYVWRTPYALTVLEAHVYLNNASSSGAVDVDVKEGGVSIFSTRPTIAATYKTSRHTGAVAQAISAPGLASDAVITFEIVGAGTGAKGLGVNLICRRA